MKRWWVRMIPYAVPERGRLAALVALVLLGIALEALMPWPLKLILDNVLKGDPLPAMVAWLDHLPGAGAAAGLLGWLTVSVLLVFLAAQGVHLAKSVLQAGVGARMQYGLARDLFEHLQALSLTFHGKASKGDLVRRVVVDSGCVPTLITGVLFPLLASILTLAALFGIMWQLDRVLALIAVAVALPMGALMKLLGPRMSERAYQQQQMEAEVWTVAEHTLTSLPLVQAFGREELEGTRFRGISSRTIRAYMRSIASQLQFKIGVDGCIAAGTAAVMVIAGMQVLRGASSVGNLVIFLSYLTALYAPLVTLAYLSPTVANAAGSARRVTELLNADESVQDAPNARALDCVGGRIRGHVRMENIVFGYEPGRPALRNVDLDVLPGQTIALVGATGAGKTTLFSLIPRLFDPWEGRVLFDGQDIRGATLASIRDQVSLVLQESFLLPLSVADNIAYARPDACREDIIAAAVSANADEFIRDLPSGYDTVIGERGVTLSGGQRQRIAIARALLKDAPILILDEPTAALDAETESEVMEAIERLTQGRTTFIIAHRLSTVRQADRIVVLDAGRVVESGTHEELLARPSLYRRLHAPHFPPPRSASGGVVA
jgi:ATP-binding cassette subfamily B protein/subfamily B ATP-binding cassette protein MsbA